MTPWSLIAFRFVFSRKTGWVGGIIITQIPEPRVNTESRERGRVKDKKGRTNAHNFIINLMIEKGKKKREKPPPTHSHLARGCQSAAKGYNANQTNLLFPESRNSFISISHSHNFFPPSLPVIPIQGRILRRSTTRGEVETFISCSSSCSSSCFSSRLVFARLPPPCPLRP